MLELNRSSQQLKLPFVHFPFAVSKPCPHAAIARKAFLKWSQSQSPSARLNQTLIQIQVTTMTMFTAAGKQKKHGKDKQQVLSWRSSFSFAWV